MPEGRKVMTAMDDVKRIAEGLSDDEKRKIAGCKVASAVFRHYVASAPMRRWLSALVMAGVIVCGASGQAWALGRDVIVVSDSGPQITPKHSAVANNMRLEDMCNSIDIMVIYSEKPMKNTGAISDKFQFFLSDFVNGIPTKNVTWGNIIAEVFFLKRENFRDFLKWGQGTKSKRPLRPDGWGCPKVLYGNGEMKTLIFNAFMNVVFFRIGSDAGSIINMRKIGSNLQMTSITRDLIGLAHGISGLAGVLNGFPSESDLTPNKPSAQTGDGKGEYRSDEHPHGPIGHVLLRYQIPKLVWVGLLCLGMWICYNGFIWAGNLFDRHRDRTSLFVAGTIIPLGGFLAAFSVGAWLSY